MITACKNHTKQQHFLISIIKKMIDKKCNNIEHLLLLPLLLSLLKSHTVKNRLSRLPLTTTIMITEIFYNEDEDFNRVTKQQVKSS